MQTTLTGKGANEPILTGDERYPVLGNLVDPAIFDKIQSAFGGLTCHWDCNNKTEIAFNILAAEKNLKVDFQLVQVIGGVKAVSADGLSAYGYEFHPPIEFHCFIACWNLKKKVNHGIIDVALPGVIEKGMTSSDDQGPFIVGREPVILNGNPPDWLIYSIASFAEIKRAGG